MNEIEFSFLSSVHNAETSLKKTTKQPNEQKNPQTQNIKKTNKQKKRPNHNQTIQTCSVLNKSRL